jgi:hypothetical protein
LYDDYGFDQGDIAMLFICGTVPVFQQKFTLDDAIESSRLCSSA